jgi:transposase
MIVLGADMHKRSHTIAAIAAATGELMGERTVQVGAKGFAALVVWARELGSERVWALEDCRPVSDSFERFLIERGERVVRVTTKLMADSRRRARGRGKSDSIDAIAVARAALREGLDALPAAQLEGPELDLRLLVDHRERLVRQGWAQDLIRRRSHLPPRRGSLTDGGSTDGASTSGSASGRLGSSGGEIAGIGTSAGGRGSSGASMLGSSLP